MRIMKRKGSERVFELSFNVVNTFFGTSYSEPDPVLFPFEKLTCGPLTSSSIFVNEDVSELETFLQHEYQQVTQWIVDGDTLLLSGATVEMEFQSIENVVTRMGCDQ